MRRKLLSLALVLAMTLALAIPAFAAENDPAWSVEFNKSAGAVVITVNGVAQSFTNWKNNQAEQYTVNGYIVSVTVKGNAIDKKALVGAAAAPAEEVISTTEDIAVIEPAGNQIVIDTETRIWQDGFGFHCNNLGGNGATAVKWNGKIYEKGVQKDIFGTKSNPIMLERVGNTTLWNLITEDIVCETCGSNEWVTYSNKNGVINGKNIQAHHRSYAEISKGWTDGNPDEIVAKFDIYRYDSNNPDGRGELVCGNAVAGVKYQLEPGTYVVAEQVKPGYKVQPDQRITVEEGKNTTVYFVNTPNEVVNYGTLSIQKTVGGENFSDWANAKGLTLAEVQAIIGGMKFIAYLLDDEGGARTGVSYEGVMGVTGVIEFLNVSGEPEDFVIGWYEVVEEISGSANNYFVGEGANMLYYVGKDGVKHENVNIISGKDGFGTVIGTKREAVGDDGITTTRNWDLPDVWNNQLGSALNELKDMGAQWIWDAEDTYKYGYDGSVVRFDFEVDVAEDTKAPIYFAADNAAAIYINGELVAWTKTAFAGRTLPATIDDSLDANSYFFESLEFVGFDGRWSEGWAHVYKEDITIPAGKNTLTIFAANSASTMPSYTGNPATGTDNDSYNLLNNPCGLIFGFQLPGATFDNEPLMEDLRGAASFYKVAQGAADLTQFGFELFKLDDSEGGSGEYDIPVYNIDNDTLIFSPDFTGLVAAAKLEPGFYVFKEVEIDGWFASTFADGLYFEIRENGTPNCDTYWLIDGEYGKINENPEFVNVAYGELTVDATITAQHTEITYEPVYEDLTEKDGTDTLVSKKNHNIQSPNSGQVPVAVNIADASILGGVNFEVADSSPSNRGIGYYYNVEIIYNEIVVTFPNVKEANVGIMANDTGAFPNGQPNNKDGVQKVLTQQNNKMSIALPADANEDGVVFLYLHIKGGIEWYTGEKKVVGYTEIGRETVTDLYTDTLTATLKDADGEVVDSKTFANGGTVTFEDLLPGEYTCILSGEGFDDQEEEVTIAAGGTATVTFSGITVINPDVEVGKTPEIGTIIAAPASLAITCANEIFFDLESVIFSPFMEDELEKDAIVEVNGAIAEVYDAE